MCSVHNIERSLRKVVTSEYRSWSLAYMAVFEAVQIHLMICSARKWRLRLNLCIYADMHSYGDFILLKDAKVNSQTGRSGCSKLQRRTGLS